MNNKQSLKLFENEVSMIKKWNTTKKHKYRVLRDLIIKYQDSIVQRSVDFENFVRQSIGGSEISTVLGKNPYSKMKQLVASKVGLTSFHGNINTMWGNVFEPVTALHTKHFLSMEHTIASFGSITGVLRGQRFSPDGIGIVKLLCKTNNPADIEKEEEIILADEKVGTNQKVDTTVQPVLENPELPEDQQDALYLLEKESNHDDKHMDLSSHEHIECSNDVNSSRHTPIIVKDDKSKRLSYYDYYLILFEYKAPSTTVPDGKIPIQYVAQPQTGLMTIPELDYSIFVNNMYRLCQFSHLKFNKKYNTDFHTSDAKKEVTVDIPYSLGIIGFYQTEENYKKYSSRYNSTHDSQNVSDNSKQLDKKMSESTQQINTYYNNEDKAQRTIIISDTTNDTNNDDTNDTNNASDERDQVNDDMLDKLLSGSKEDAEKATSEILAKQTLYNTEEKLIFVDSYEDPIDFSNEQSRTIEKLFLMIKEEKITPVYLEPSILKSKLQEIKFLKKQGIIHDKETPLEMSMLELKQKANLYNFYNDCKNNNQIPVGFMSYKLFKTDLILIERDANFRTMVEPQVENCLNIIGEILKDNPTQEQIKARYDAKFPSMRRKKAVYVDDTKDEDIKDDDGDGDEDSHDNNNDEGENKKSENKYDERKVEDTSVLVNKLLTDDSLELTVEERERRIADIIDQQLNQQSNHQSSKTSKASKSSKTTKTPKTPKTEETVEKKQRKPRKDKGVPRGPKVKK